MFSVSRTLARFIKFRHFLALNYFWALLCFSFPRLGPEGLMLIREPYEHTFTACYKWRKSCHRIQDEQSFIFFLFLVYVLTASLRFSC